MDLSKIKSRYAGVQTRLKNISDYGCLFLALCTIIEEVTGKEADIIGIIQLSRQKGWLSADYTVEDSIAILNEYTGKSFKREIFEFLPDTIKDNEFTIEKWYNPRTGYTHFKRRFVDTLLSSVTVKEGRIKEYYIYSYCTEQKK
jgi:hypothetical protein